MLVFALFCAIVLLSLGIQWLSNNWLLATSTPCFIFIIAILFSSTFALNKTIAFFLGVPMIFFAGLLGSYIYETRLNPNRHEENAEKIKHEIE